MKTLMKTIGILSLFFALSTFVSCEKDDDIKLDKPEQTEQLFALPTTEVKSDSTGIISDEDITKGIVIGTKSEMQAYIDELTKARENAEGDVPVNPYLMSQYQNVGEHYFMLRPTTGGGVVGPQIDPCYKTFRRYQIDMYSYFLNIANETCSIYHGTWICVDGNSYTFTVAPTSIDCTGVRRLKFTKYAFKPDDDGPKVEEFIENLSAF